MDVDLKGLIAQVLTPDIARQLASSVGMDDGQGKTFVDAAIPSLLAAFLGALERPDGAKALSDAVSNSDPNAIEKLKRALAARDLQPLSDGANALSPVLGQGVRDQLANGLATLIDVPIEAAMPALGAVEQAAVAVLGEQDPSLWSDADSIKTFLSGQKAAILAAAPAALVGLAGVAAAPKPPAPPPPPPAPAAAPAPPPRPAPAPPPPRTAPPPPPPPPPAGGGMRWLVIVIIVIVAAAGYYFWMKNEGKPAATGFNPPSTEFALRASPDLAA